MSKHLRRRTFVDRDVQGALITHLVRYWILSVAAAGGLTFLGWMFVSPGLSGFVGPQAFMARVLPMMLVGIVASALVLPVLVYSLVRLSHRFVGPIVRFKRHLREAADGGPLEPLHFRDEDFWPDLAEAYNDLLERLEADRTSEEPAGRRQADEEDIPATVPIAASDVSMAPANA